VPVLLADGSREVLDSPDGQFKIHRYRPRIEGLFARIERWTKVDSGEEHWRSISKDNITTLYGQTAESRVADPDEPTHIFSWLICESYDDKGNAIWYEYKAEDSDGVDIAQAHEHNRTQKSRAVNRYLKHIRYGNQTPRKPNEDLSQRTDWLFEVVFDYGEHELTNPKPDDSSQWSMRNDPFSSYRAGFEVRTYRLCQRVLMFHHFPEEKELDGTEVGKDCLVRSTDFTYSYEQNPSDVRNPIYSFLLSATQTGYKRNPAGGYIQKSLPPLEFTYSEATIDETVRDIDPDSLENLPYGLDGTKYQWVDLDGEGLSGILTEQGDGWFYKRNLSPVNAVLENGKKVVEARFAPVERVATKPASGLGNGAQFLDLGGDGQPDLVTFRGATPGFYERTQDEDWESFVAFKSLPVVDWDNLNLKFIDLNGDGHSDILISEDNCFVWHLSLAEDGFAAAERVYHPWDEEKGPRVIFADSTQSIYLADMSGDGLTDVVRIRNGEVSYWPNLGYGRFGARVAMDNAPWFEASDIFNQRRIQLADIDGTGTTDILYLSGSGVQVYFNQSGNGWTAKRTLSYFPSIDSVVSTTAFDLLGNGTACLVWSSPLPGDTRRAMRYIDLMGGQKPHLLLKTVNNMGAETVVEYAPSTKFYLQDKLAGTPWITKLPFPVHVVERVETYDRISGNRFVSRHAYHHGFFDGVEREFRGFGWVEQWDTEEIGTIPPGDATSDNTNLDVASFVPPVLTKTWFHTGAYFGGEKISQQFEHEYYREPNETDTAFAASLLPDTILPAGLTADEEREAARSLKGHILRLEIYALDGSDKQPHPYSVSERNYEIRLEQAVQTNRHAVFFAHDRETIDYHYERNPVDPRVTHTMTLEVDEFGNGLKSVAIAYPRRKSAYPEQAKTFITYTENQVTNKPNDKLGDPDWYRIGVPIETRTYEITGIDPPQPPLERGEKSFELIRGQLESAVEIPYETIATTGVQKRLIERVRTLYRRDNDANTIDPTCLPLGQIDSLALPCESYKMAFTPGLLAQVYSSKISTADLGDLLRNEGKYVEQDGVWWIPSGRQVFDPAQFYLAIATKDPFGQTFTTTYDPYKLLPIKSADPVGNVVQIRNDYRVMQPWEITDPNLNLSQAAFDALGMVVGTAVMGKATGSAEGDLLANFKADLTSAEITAFFDATDPRSLAIQHLDIATTRIIYDLDRVPVCAAAIARKTHVSDLTGRQLQLDEVQVSFVYSDGFGREAQTKAQAEPGPLDLSDPKAAIVNPRWVGTGTKVYNNKGKPVRQYEPFFSPDHKFGIERHGVSSTLFYDPMERVVMTLHPNHTYEKVVFDPWKQDTWDVNDTVVQTAPDTIPDDPKTDPDVGHYFKRLPDPDYLPTWHKRFSSSAIAAEREAAQKALAHAGTPTIAHFDTLGRPFLTIADNGKDANNNDQKYSTRVELDIEGNQRVVTDARGNRVMVQDFDLLSHVIHSQSGDAGEQWMLNNVAGHPIRAWDSRGFSRRFTYDLLQRPLGLFVNDRQGEKLAETTTYGESQGDAKNHRGKVYQVFDGAGVVTSVEYDFKGNLLRSTRQLLQRYQEQVNWLTSPQLEIKEVFTSSTLYDALNRPIRLFTPSTNDIPVSEIRPTYNEANLLEQVKVKLRGAAEETLFVKNIDYNEKGQRTLIEYGSGLTQANRGVTTTYTYDPQTFRLTRLRTTRGQAPASSPLLLVNPQTLQDLTYTYDPVGNITEIRDGALPVIVYGGEQVVPVGKYTYDALYRLIQAQGREHAGQNNYQPTATRENNRDYPFQNLPNANDMQALRNYTEEYRYDPVGNILAMMHGIQNGGWNRAYDYESGNNRLRATSLPGDASGTYSARYGYDNHGNMTRMPHFANHADPNQPNMHWDFKDQLHQVDLGGGGTAYYVYDASGQRVRKVHEHNGATVEERIYLGGFERYRKRNGSGLTLERETLHIMDDQKRIALVETKTRDTTNNTDLNTPILRYQLDNHLGSACLELDDGGNVISYEEYHPYGPTSYQASSSVGEVSLKRYRYTGKERDEESGLYYHGARYYAPWLGRWTSCDPAGLVDGTNLYAFTLNNPVRLTDPNGTDSEQSPLIDASISRKVEHDYRSGTGSVTSTISVRVNIPFFPFTLSTSETTGLGQVEGERSTQAPLPSASTRNPATESDAHQPTHASAPSEQPQRTNERTGEGFWKSIVSGNSEAGFGKSLIPVLGSVQNANYHFDKGNWVRGIAYTALAISDVFLVRSLVTGAFKLAQRGTVSLIGIGRTLLKELAPNEGIGSGTKLITKLKRFFVQDLKTYKPDASVIYRVLREHFKVSTRRGLQSMFEMHHWLIQHGWYKGSNAVNNPFLRRVLQKIGDAGWNLIPIPGPINNALGKSALATISFAEKILSTISQEFQWTINNFREKYQ
jgi:RHS repeat-associated protein